MHSHREKTRALLNIDIQSIRENPNQPRKVFDMYELSALAESIRQNGIIEPLTVRKTDTGYELIAGERRLRAAVIVGLRYVPCHVFSVSEQNSAVISLVENLQRKELNMFEEAEAISNLVDTCGYTQQEASELLGITPATLSNKLRMLKLTASERRKTLEAGLSERHVRALIRISDDRLRQMALDKMITEIMNTDTAEKFVDSLLTAVANEQKSDGARARHPVFCDTRILGNTFQKMLDTLKRSGFQVSAEQTENDDFVELLLKIPKKPTG